MIGSRVKCCQWIPPCLYVLSIIAWFSWECSAQGGFIPIFGIVLNLTTYKVTLTVGDTLSVNATYQSTPAAHTVIWLKDDTQLYIQRPEPSVVGRLVILPPLTIINVNCEDAGEYVLFVNNSRGHHFSSPLTVYVIVPAGQPVSDPENKYCLHAPICSPLSATDIFVVEGTSQNLNVNVITNPNLTFADWFHNNDFVNRSNPRYLNGDATTPSLTIGNTIRTDKGSYRLYTNNSIGPLRTPDCEFNLTVGYPPEFDCGCNSTQCLVVNETESCFIPVNNIDAFPATTAVQWFKGDNPIDNSTGRFRGGDVTNPSLTLVNTTRQDSGYYIARADNRAGFRQGCRCCCTVQFRPTCVLISPPTPYTVTEGTSFTISVTLTALPPPGFVDWTMNNVPVNRTGARYVSGDTTTPSLEVRQIHRNDAGIYALIANNTVGVIADTDCRVNITVNYFPLCTLLSNSTLVVNEFSTFTIDVTLDSVPPAHTVGWTKDNNPVNRAGGRFLNGDSYSIPSLTVINVTRRETGVYVMDATNIVGNIVERSRCSVNVTIQYKPDICPNGCARNYTICEDAPVTLECTADSVPSINRVTWRKDGRALNGSTPRYSGGNVTIPSLTIHRSIPGDRGAYECVVGNVVGTATYQISLEVFSKPAVSVTRTRIVLVEGQSSSLGCSVDMRTNPPPVVVQWFKDGVRIESNSGRYQHGDLDVPSLTISNIQREDAGVYSCGAINSIGDRQSSNIVVTVEYPPVVKARFNNYGIPLHTSAMLWCSIEANPPVASGNVTWVRDSLFSLPSTSCSDVTANLKVCRLDVTTSGVYRCRASHTLATKHSEDISVSVRSDCPLRIEGLRLSDGAQDSSVSSGMVEVKIGRNWGTVCGRDWSSLATQAVCRMFNYSYGMSQTIKAGTGPIHLGHVRCGSGATTLGECELTSNSDCTHQDDIWVQCSSIPLITTPLAGISTEETTSTATTTATVTTSTAAGEITTEATSATLTTNSSTEAAAVVCPSVASNDLLIALLAALAALLLLAVIIIISMCCCHNRYCKCVWLHSVKSSEKVDGKVTAKKRTNCMCCVDKPQVESDNSELSDDSMSGKEYKKPPRPTDKHHRKQKHKSEPPPPIPTLKGGKRSKMTTRKPSKKKGRHLDSQDPVPSVDDLGDNAIETAPAVDNPGGNTTGTSVDTNSFYDETPEEKSDKEKKNGKGVKDKENQVRKMKRKSKHVTPPEFSPDSGDVMVRSTKDTLPLLPPSPGTSHDKHIPGNREGGREGGGRNEGNDQEKSLSDLDQDISRIIGGLNDPSDGPSLPGDSLEVSDDRPSLHRRKHRPSVDVHFRNRRRGSSIDVGLSGEVSGGATDRGFTNYNYLKNTGSAGRDVVYDDRFYRSMDSPV